MGSKRSYLVLVGIVLVLAIAVFGAGDRVSVNVKPSAQYMPGLAAGPVCIGSWYGKAIPLSPETSPFPEVIMTPTFFADGNVIANDSHELTHPHATAHGSWVTTGLGTMRAVFVWMNLSAEGSNGFEGTFKVVLNGRISTTDPDVMLGTLHAYLYPVGLNPLDPAAEGIDVGVFQIEELRRIRPY